MVNNGSPYWKDPRRADPPAPNAELLAALEQIDVSEPMRAAISHALGEPAGGDDPAGGADPTEGLVSRYLGERDRRPDAGRSSPVNDPRHQYTLHLTFPAADLHAARAKAISYAEGLAALRPEVGTSTPLLSRAETWNHLVPLFCGATCPPRGICIAAPGHAGPHHSAALRAHHWGHRNQRHPDPPAVPADEPSGGTGQVG